MKKSTFPKYLQRLLIMHLAFLFTGVTSYAQDFPAWKPTPNDTLNSCTILSDGKIRFSIYAPQAGKVLLSGTDIPDNNRGTGMSKRSDGVWEVVIGPLKPGAYRYNFNVDGITVLDPRNPITSESNVNSWSLMYMGGADFMETKDVPHGAIAEVTYFSGSLKRFRRMHIYTPPGYESGEGKFPVFYLLHGVFDCDDAWTSVGRAGFILDNLIAGKKARPMVVVMPAGHTGPIRFDPPGSRPQVDEFLSDFTDDIIPYVEKNYRVFTEGRYRALAGLSMGGAQTLNIAVEHLDRFDYLGIFSSGIFGLNGREGAIWEETHVKVLDDAELKKNLQLIWFATGKEDFLLETSRVTVELLKRHGFDVIYKETSGGHTWINWRNYLYEFAPLLFQ
jgi:enterochelin esterase-like enzyme